MFLIMILQKYFDFHIRSLDKNLLSKRKIENRSQKLIIWLPLYPKYFNLTSLI